MKTSQRFASLPSGMASVLFFSILLMSFTAEQSPSFDISAYKTCLQAMYAAGSFMRDVSASLNGIAYFDPIDNNYRLTAYEKQLLRKHSFVVMERLSPLVERSTMCTRRR